MDRNIEELALNLPKFVVPYVGTWIEIIGSGTVVIRYRSRSLRGNVDRNVVVNA